MDVQSECGSHIVLATNLGDFKLDTTHLWHDGGRVEVMGTFAKGRKLQTASLTAFYDDVEKIEFQCSQVWLEETGMYACMSYI